MFSFFWLWPFARPGSLWRYQLIFGILLVLAGIVIVLVPEVLVALVAGLVMLAGMSLIASALRARAFEQRRRVQQADPFEWW